MNITASHQAPRAVSTSLFSPQPLTFLSEGLSLSALRKAWQAMIAPLDPVRNTSDPCRRLIALLTPRRAPASIAQGLMFVGLQDDEPLCFQESTIQARTSAGKTPQICGKSAATMFDVAGLISWLKDRFPRSTIHHVEAETGIPAASVENWLHRRSQPSVQHFSILMQVYGPSLLAACFKSPPKWLSEAARSQRRLELEAQIAELEKERWSTGGAQ
ncbi:unknown [Sinorhizobium phage PBC5]|uniref:hypothetical protein n=1 Tax=Sinorhizobium phage PBC5 TaxID=179237 RepID=UPI000009B38A|nr:hypothetical protein PBC5_gp38 [Sinorhizobium phage PBC5]AAL49594.1 unknown [Sinorhizobium phage PBC5]